MNAERIIAVREIHQTTVRAVFIPRACRVVQRIAVQPAPAASECLQGRIVSRPKTIIEQVKGST